MQTGLLTHFLDFQKKQVESEIKQPIIILVTI